ncbi:calcium-activated chloride channel regulator 1 [Zootoca vivipara]|uniref:calcium-activated chloride channel regulator 1 n=1 Tax=Zootoca vivipara TaxID=8524 RepID=UPI00293BB64E|nr:calcium-activated chloride channel regulator 1 [Zootoca vivipara]XP_060132739.1 calcium-activated chloride channel regulator 1 [Zootoca vivipara]XP_060132740.1 calcium-activated chloride channel regulator 1 [Zootoca vivipara]XP_060132741.1 calcium-activated chloride channel regulator 1 [Zootoca vivipara]
MMMNCWLLLALQVLHGVAGTMVKLNNGGFEDLVIAINPGIPEDGNIVDRIKDMVKEASTYLFSATQQRFYFKTVKIVIPSTWKEKAEYQRVTTETYDKADVIVADSFPKYGDDPYTLQYGGCGEPGRYIHFTPNFLTNDNLLNAYGPRGRVFVHEWAHLRWGVFDEYNNDAPFYATGGDNLPEATRCSTDFTGKYVFPLGGNQYRRCKIDPQTQLFEHGCAFFPNRRQDTAASIMYLQSLPSVTQFCNKSNHNIKATNLQNKMCNYRSSWEVIMASPDFASSSPITVPPPDPTISLLKKHERVLCLVLDVSGSMDASNRIGRQKQAAEIFILQIIEAGSWVGIVTFSSGASILTGLKQISSNSVRQTLADYLPTSAGGGTNICSGVRSGFQVFLQKYSTTKGCEIVLLTDGEDNAITSCFEEVQNSGSIIHTIALGESAAEELERLAELTGGSKFSATDNLDSNGLINAFSGISSGSGDISQQSIQLESRGQSVNSKDQLNGIVTIDKTVGNDTFFVVTWGVSPPGILLTDPKGREYTDKDFAIDSTNVQTARLKIDGTAERGDWIYSIQNTYSKAQVLSITVTTRAASVNVAPVIVKSFMNSDTNMFPSPMVIYAEVSQGFLPVIGAKVIATVEPETGPSEEVELLDNGSGADILKNDGIYSRYFTSFKGNGRHNLKVRVKGKDKVLKRSRRQSHALYMPGFAENGTITMNPPKPEANFSEPEGDLGNVTRIVSGGSFVVSGVPPGGSHDVLPPCKITDLDVQQTNDGGFILSWTAPGNNYDVGKAEKYEIKMGEKPSELTNATFDSATPVNTAGLMTEAAGTKQSFHYKPVNFAKENGTSIYFAIRCIDGSNNVGEVSNIARAVVLLPAWPRSPTHPITISPTPAEKTIILSSPDDKHAGPVDKSTIIIVIIACVSAIIVLAVVGIAVWILHKRKYGNYVPPPPDATVSTAADKQTNTATHL